MIVNIDPIKSGDSASPNLWNSRFSALTAAINGNIDSDNLRNGAITTEKIANGAVTSNKLGFQQYTDENGWLITDLGLVKLATKIRTFSTANIGQGNTSFVTFDDGMNTNPVGFNANAPYNMIWSFSGNGNVGRYTFLVESGNTNPQPNTAVVQYQTLPPVQVQQMRMHVWVIF